jgi:hypothetical protein
MPGAFSIIVRLPLMQGTVEDVHTASDAVAAYQRLVSHARFG